MNISKQKILTRAVLGCASVGALLVGVIVAPASAVVPTQSPAQAPSVASPAEAPDPHGPPPVVVPVDPDGPFEANISDEQLADCLLKIAVLPREAVGDGYSPSVTSSEFSDLVRTLYYEHPDTVGFGMLVNGPAIMNGNIFTEYVAPVPAGKESEFAALDAELTTSLNLHYVDLVSKPGTATVRTVCAAFLDVMSYPPLAEVYRHASIDERTNDVEFGVREDALAVATRIAADRYGPLVRVVGGGEVIDESRNATSPPTGAGTGLWRADTNAR